ncbi:MAG TPA: Gfo/Idh/MocA family oxidoreductase [Armatimonadota bacterium]|nr:Gfo/Idh/MocA family oxidoreductase [Armatimonadota bacterium]
MDRELPGREFVRFPDESEKKAAGADLRAAPECGRKVRVAFVGAGGIAAYHLANLARIPEAEVVAICDLVPEAIDRAIERVASGGQELAPTPFADYHEMLDRQEMDALYVCVPPFAHEDAELLAARRGVHLFVEKPVALNLDKALEILAAVRKAGIIASTGYLLRYWESTQAARRFLSGRDISLVACDRWSGIPGGPGYWWRDVKCSGGQLHEMTTHQVDLMRYLAGEIVRVDCRHSKGVLRDQANLTVPDSQIALLEFASGAIGYVSNSCVLTRGGHQSRLAFVLRDCVLGWGETLSLNPETVCLLPEYPEGALNIDEAFIGAIVGSRPELVYSPYDEAVRTLAVTVAARESALGRAVVTVPSV